jgi:hypothetical protein
MSYQSAKRNLHFVRSRRKTTDVDLEFASDKIQPNGRSYAVSIGFGRCRRTGATASPSATAAGVE